MIGFGEIIALLLSLGGFGVTTNPSPPTPEQSLAYAMPEAELVVHLDLVPVVPGNYKVLTKLAEDPAVKAVPELRDMVRQLTGQVDAGRGMAQGLLGLDVVQDLSSATAFLRFVPQRDPSYVLAVRGKFPADLVAKAAQLSGGTASKVGALAMADLGDENALGLTRDGVLLLGTAALVKARLADTWRAPARAAGSTMGKMAEVLATQPFFAVGGALSPAVRGEAAKEMKAPNFLLDLVQRHKFFALAMYPNGVGWRWDDSSAAGLASMKLFSEGTLEVMRAAQIAPRGMAKMAAAAMESYRGMDKRLDEVIRRKDDLIRLVNSTTGDGKFAATVNADPRALRLDVRATGSRLSEVMPSGLLLPLLAGAYFSFQSGSSSGSGPTLIERPAPPPPSKGGAPKKAPAPARPVHKKAS